ncbi:MAG: peptidoglycan-binding protein LysM [Flavobacteriaceae bacterium]|nr:peptidoglycan-binding protein LysM [Flavobacteriaceae bacterium]
MKQIVMRIVLVGFIVILSTFAFSSFKEADLSHYLIEDDEVFCYHVPNEHEVSSLKTTPQYQLFLGKTYVGFKEAIAFKESRGNYTTVNTFGYLGKYQFGKGTLHMIGIKNSDNFLNDTRLQEEAFDAYTARNKWILRRDIKRYVGTYIDGVKVTESGILAAAHLAGAGNVKKYLRSGGVEGFTDGFGTSIRYYLKKFSGYNTSFIKPQKLVRVM